ncbi:hypothetical protein HPP92_024353 [Vanilla planifolia]|uniref:YqaJ viral recombinase domain-containing protein n=1 Tax=Vanilla planifolia TaxID=51239 RepID=A0A835UCW2_VANPL|nr:hypothetical protein HPP92_024353 [Vanilla planifolia]
MRLTSVRPRWGCVHDSRKSAPGVSGHIPLRTATLAATFSGVVIPIGSVYNFGRAIQANPNSCCSFHSISTMTHAFIARSRLILPRNNYEGYIPVTCTASILKGAPSAVPITSQLTSSNVPQRSKEWFTLRKDKLTTSTFSTALGFWKGNRRSELWQHKVFNPESDCLKADAMAAMNWGVTNEPAAIEHYKSMTGQDVSFLGFAVHGEATSGWLGASPDGLVGFYPNAGILEVKCPYNKGKPELGLPWQAVPYYYMPQVQGQMEIMDREWADLYCWTPNGSSLFRVFRDRGYWELMHVMLRDFWWGNVVPARQALMCWGRWRR